MWCHGLNDEDELYDLKNDPTEMTNLFDDPNAKTTLRKMQAELKPLLKQTGASRAPSWWE